MTGRDSNPTAQPGTGSNGVSTHCLLWLPRGYDAPVQLVRGLDRRHVRVREVHDAPAVMAQLATCPSDASVAKAIILVEPDLLNHTQQLVEAVAAYYPKAIVWRYRMNGQPALTPWEDTPSAPPRPTSAPAQPEPADRMADEPDDDDGPLLTDEELAMLLGDGPDPEPRRNG